MIFLGFWLRQLQGTDSLASVTWQKAGKLFRRGFLRVFVGCLFGCVLLLLNSVVFKNQFRPLSEACKDTNYMKPMMTH